VAKRQTKSGAGAKARKDADLQVVRNAACITIVASIITFYLAAIFTILL